MENKSQQKKVLNLRRISKYAILPKRSTEGSAGLDLYACIEKEILLNPGKKVFIPCGIAVSLPSNEYAAFIFARSGLGVKHGITLSNGVGVVDSDYRGEIGAGLINLGEEPYVIKPGDRIAQMVIMPVSCMPVIEVESLDDTERGSGGFGSTGK